MLSRYDESEGKFNSDQIADKIADFEEKVSGKLTNAPTGRFLIAAGIFGALVIPCGLPASCAIALPFLVNAVKKAIKNGHQAEYVAKTGIFCHLLNHHEIAQLIRFTGRKFIVDQTVQAHIDGMKLTPAAIEIVELIEGELTPTTFEEVRRAFAPETPRELASVGSRTRLGAINVQAETAPIQSSKENQLFDTLINNPYQCRAILAGQRAGKTLSAAVATHHLAKTGTWIGYINLFDHNQGNAEMMSHANCVISNLTALGNTPKAHDLVNDAINLMDTFYAQDDAILVIDEWASMGVKTLKIDGIGELWNAIANKATALSSQGVGSGKAIWGIAPFFKAESVHDAAKSLKLFAPLVLSIAPGQVVHWTNPKTGKQTQISYNAQVVNHAALNWNSAIKDPTDEQARSWKRQGVDRVFWWNGRWNSIGALPVGALSEVPKSKPKTACILDARQHLEVSLSASEGSDHQAIRAEADPAIELINSIEDSAKREAMLIAYQWAQNRTKDGREVDKVSFMARARNDRNCDYLREHRDSIWHELEVLIS